MSEPIVGTPIECEAQLRMRFEAMRRLMELRDQEAGTDHASTFERSVWVLALEPADGLASSRARRSLEPEVSRIDIERELFDALSSAVGGDGEQEGLDADAQADEPSDDGQGEV